MAELSDTHELIGTFYVPRTHEPAAAEAIEPSHYDHLDVGRYKALLERRLAIATRGIDDPTISADARQYAVGVKHGLATALALLTGTRIVAAPLAEPEEPHS